MEWDFPHKADAPDLSVVSPPVKDKFNIFMFHGPDMNFTNQAYKPVTSADLKDWDDYYALAIFTEAVLSIP